MRFVITKQRRRRRNEDEDGSRKHQQLVWIFVENGIVVDAQRWEAGNLIEFEAAKNGDQRFVRV